MHLQHCPYAGPAGGRSLTVLAAAAAVLFASGPAQSQEAAGGLQEVVITATKRATLASKTPISLATITGDDLKSEGASDTKRLAELMPNVQLSSGSLGAVEVSIRGIGSSNNTEVGDPAVGVSIDGVYLGRPQMAGAALFDVERVEVLRGPQGTLYGRNSTAGAINVITRKPTNIFEGAVSLGLSNYNGRQADAMLNIPVNDMLSLRGVASVNKRDGYIDTAHAPANDFSKDKSGIDNTSARLHALLKVSPATSVRMSADYAHDRGAGAGTVQYAVFQANPTGSAGRYVPTSRYEGRNDVKGSGLSAELNQGLSFADLTVIGAHREQERALLYSVATAATGAFNYANFKQDSIEARLASKGNATLQWVGGGYFFREKGSPIVLQAFGPSTMFYQDPMITRSGAVFGQGTYAVVPSLRLTAGLRYTHDTKSRSGCSYPFSVLNSAGLTGLTNPANPMSDAPDAASLPACPTANINSVPATSWNQLTYRTGVDYDLDANTMVYLNYATGFKAGGFNDGNLATASNVSAIIYNPEKLAAIEAGFKGRYLQRRLQVSGSAFSYRYSDLQVSSLTTCASGSGTCTLTQNAGKAASKGLELEGRYLLTQADKVNFGLGWTDAKYTQFTTSGGVNWNGQKLDKAPAVVVNLGYSHQFGLSSGAALTAFIGSRYSSGYQLSNPAANAHFTQSAYHKTDAHVTYASADDKWTVQAYVRNIEDRNVATSYQASGGQHGVYLAEPRLFGLRGTVKF